jgi:hypothetical protein
MRILQHKDDDATFIFENLWKKFIYNVNIILCDENGKILMVTFTPFTNEACHNTQAIRIGEFVREQNMWNNQNFFQYKLKNFHNCTVTASTFEYPPAVIGKVYLNKSFTLHGSDIELVNGLKSILNFHLNLSYSNEPGAYGMTFDNGTVTGIKVDLVNNRTDFIFGLYYATYPNCLYMGCSQAYFAVTFLVIVPQVSLSSIEKLFVPFTLDLWIIFLTIIFIATTTILLLSYKLNSNVRNFVIGSNIKSPFNVLLTSLIGGSLIRLPKRNFARYLLMVFILFSLVMRTVYVGGLFKYLKSDTKVVAIKTIDELLARRYKIYGQFYFMSYLQNMGLGEQ